MGTKGTNSSGLQYNPKGVTQGNTLVDPNTGLPISVTTDNTGTRRLAVDADITAGDITVETRDLDASTDNVAIKDTVTGAKLKINVDGSIDSNVVLNANTDSVSVGNTLVPEPYDYVGLVNTTIAGQTVPTTVVYKTGGASGTLVATLTLAYDTSANLTSVTRT